MAFLMRCPDCRQKFPMVEGRIPEFCPNEDCVSRTGNDRADDDVVMPFIRTTSHTARADKLYRDMERGSEIRAEAADAPSLKMTNLLDARHPGEIAEPPVRNVVTEQMEAINARGGSVGFQGANGLGFSEAVAVGYGANAGAHMQSVLRQDHLGRAGPDAVSDRPANEINQPGYRRRV